MPLLPVRALLRVPPPPEGGESKILEHEDHYNINGFELKKGPWKIIPFGLSHKDIINELAELIYVMVQGISVSLRFLGPSDDLLRKDGLMDLIASTLRCIPSTRRVKTKKTHDMTTWKIQCTSAYNGIVSEGEIVATEYDGNSDDFGVVFYICTCTTKSYDSIQDTLERIIGKEKEELKGYKLSLEPYSLLDSLLAKGNYSLLKSQKVRSDGNSKGRGLSTKKQNDSSNIADKSIDGKGDTTHQVENQQPQKGTLASLLNLAKEREEYVTRAKNEARSKIMTSSYARSVHPLTRLLLVEKFVQENKLGERYQDIQQVFLTMVGLYGLIINSLKAADQAKAIEAFQLDVASKIEEKIKELRTEEEEMGENDFKSAHVYSGPFRAITEMALDVSRIKTQRYSTQNPENKGKETDNSSDDTDDTDDDIENEDSTPIIHRLQTATPTKVPSAGLPPSRYAYYSFIRGAGYDRDELLKELRNISSSSSLFLDKLLNDTSYKPKYARKKTSEEEKCSEYEEGDDTTMPLQAAEILDYFSERGNNIIEKGKKVDLGDYYSEIQKQQQRNKLKYLSVLRLSPLAQLRASKPGLEKVLNEQEKLITEQKVQMKATQLAMDASSSATEEILGVLDSQNALYRGLLESARRVLLRTKDAALSVAERIVTCNKNSSPSLTTSPISFADMGWEEDNYGDEFLEDFDDESKDMINSNDKMNNNGDSMLRRKLGDPKMDSRKPQLLRTSTKLGGGTPRIKRGYFSSKPEVTLNRPLSPSASIKSSVQNSYNSPIDSFSDEENTSSRSPSPPQTSQYYNGVIAHQNSVLEDPNNTKNEEDTQILSFKSLDDALRKFEDVQSTRAKHYAELAAKKVKLARARERGRIEAMAENIDDSNFEERTKKADNMKMSNNVQNNDMDGSLSFGSSMFQNSDIIINKKDEDELPFGDIEGNNAKWRETMCRDATIGISSLHKQVEDEIYKLERMMTKLSLKSTGDSTPKVAGKRGRFSRM